MPIFCWSHVQFAFSGVPVFELPNHIHEAIETICRSHNVHLLEIQVRGSSHRRVVEVFVDNEKGIGLDECGTLNALIGDLLDESEVFPASYRLEVSSPGIDRPLTEQWQFSKNIGRLLDVTTRDGATLTGRLVNVQESAIVLDIDGRRKKAPAKSAAGGAESEELELALEELEQAIVRIEW